MLFFCLLVDLFMREAIFCPWPCPPQGPHYKQSCSPAWRLGGQLHCERQALSSPDCQLLLTVPNTLTVPYNCAHSHMYTHINTWLHVLKLLATCVLGHTRTRTLRLLLLLRVRLHPNVHPESRWSTVMCVPTSPQQYTPTNTHTHAHTALHICALHIPLHFTFSKKCISTHPNDNRTSPLSGAHNCASNAEVKGHSSERASWVACNETDSTGLCMCASLLTRAKPLQHHVYFCTLARAPLPYFCTAVTVFVSKPSSASNPVHSL